MQTFDLPRRLTAEFVGTAFLLATVVGSGIMGETLADGNVALALLGNTLATGAILMVLILVFGVVSGAHFNPAVTLAFRMQGGISNGHALAYVVVQVAGGLAGVFAAHVMFAAPLIEFSATVRTGAPQWVAEAIATFGLVLTILGCLHARPAAVPYAVGLYISAGYWFASSTSFANPAVTVARILTDTFSGIRPADAPVFILAQFVGAALAALFVRWITAERDMPAG